MQETKQKEPIWAHPKVVSLNHRSFREKEVLEGKLENLPQTIKGDLIRAVARLRFNQKWHAKTMEYGFLNEARKQGAIIDKLLQIIIDN